MGGDGMFGYKPAGMEMWDAWCIAHDGKLHMLHLQYLSPDSERSAQEAASLGHAVTENLVHWEERPLALAPGEAGGDDDLQPWTGCVYKRGDTFYLYYTMRSSRDGATGQRIGLAASVDLKSWERHSGNPIIVPDPAWYVSHDQPLPNGVVDCRDLVVVDSPDGKGWYGFYAARVHGDELSDGTAVAVVRSHDLIYWEHLPPAFVPRKYACVEVPDVFFMDGRWYMTCLTGHGYGNRGIYREKAATQGTIYAVSDSIEGPYTELPDDQLLLAGDDSCGYSCRSFEFGGKRYAFYTERPTNTVGPPMEVCTTSEGRLRLRYSPLTELWRQKALLRRDETPQIAMLPYSHENWGLPGGSWSIEGSACVGQANRGWQIADIGIGSPDMELEANITIVEGTAAGLVWRGDSQARGCGGNLVIMLDAEEGVVRAGTAPSFGEPWYRPWAIERGKTCHVRVMIRRPRVEVYVDDLLVLQFACPFADSPHASAGLFVDRGKAAITDMAVYALSPISAER